MRVDVVTLFPEIFPGPLGVGVVGRAIERGALVVCAHDLRADGIGPHRQVDDEPFGGGPGMVLRPEPIFAAVRRLRALPGHPRGRGILLGAHGRRFDATMARAMAAEPRLIVVCGRYQGIDERVVDGLDLDEVSIGDVVLSGGELAAMVVIEAVARHLPGTLGTPESLRDESFTRGTVEHPHYTRPATFEGRPVPDVLRSGDHAAIARWRLRSAAERAARLRPDLVTLDPPPEGRVAPAPEPSALAAARGGQT